MSTDFDDDPPTVVSRGNVVTYDPLVNHRIDLTPWTIMPTWMKLAFLRVERLLSWFASL